MINVTKSQPAPACLEAEKAKNNGTYLCGDVFERIHADFHGKCYICEHSKPTKINVEHFKPHYQGKNLDRKFDWNNLFYACAHCNGIKSSDETEYLNCTYSEHKITDWIHFDIKPFPKELVKISALKDDELVKNTVFLLNQVYNYQYAESKFTPTKEAANNLRKILITEIKSFVRLLEKYFEDLTDESDKIVLKRKILKHVKNPKSPFLAFKLRIIQDNYEYRKEFLS